MGKTPCLFDYATSELSQDAFFAWLLEWADDGYTGAVHDMSRKFLQGIFEEKGISLSDSIKVGVWRQYKHIDVYGEITAATGEVYALILEDKTYTTDHDNQLARYLDTAKAEKDYANIIGLYVTTGDQSNYNAVDAAGYVLRKRQDILALFESPEGERAIAENGIVADFARHLETMDKAVSCYKTLPLDKWDGNAWKGFFMALQKELGDGEWNYVANPSGGFMGFWWHWKLIENGQASLYLQLEEGKACFKVECGELDPAQLKWAWHGKVVESAKKLGVNAVKPDVMRKGYWMTVAVLATEYRVVDSNGFIDLAATVSGLRKMESVIDAIAETAKSN